MQSVQLDNQTNCQIHKQLLVPDFPDIDEPVVVDLNDPVGTLVEHLELNRVAFENAYPDFTVDPVSRMIVSSALNERNIKRFLFSSKLLRYNYLHPALYRMNCAVTDIEFGSLIAKLHGIPSVVDATLYSAVLPDCKPGYMELFV